MHEYIKYIPKIINENKIDFTLDIRISPFLFDFRKFKVSVFVSTYYLSVY